MKSTTKWLLLILVLVPGVGRNVNGSQRWLALGPLTLQPSELAKAAMILFLVENTLHFTVGNAVLTGHVNPLKLLRMPMRILTNTVPLASC